jgi:hypothetical protein
VNHAANEQKAVTPEIKLLADVKHDFGKLATRFLKKENKVFTGLK